MHDPMVTVVLPTFNNREDIGAAIDSLLAQTFEDWELIVVDDASTDGTGGLVAERYDDPRISLHTMAINAGAGACRNLALSKARGELVAVLDADDEYLPTKLEKQVEVFADDASVSAVGCQVFEFGQWGGPELGRWPTQAEDIHRRQVDRKVPIHHSTAVFKRTELEEVGGWDAACRRAEDFALFLRLGERKMVCLEEALYMYRTRRPLPLSYVITDQLSHDLALRRHELWLDGLDDSAMPTDTKLSTRTVIQATKNWIVRTGQEYLSAVLRRRP
ncbi:glycosyltransferase family 2 protein [Kocuria sp. M4R2S49]|uniref:glycosyltransferase family 2 protein n=1 Tax=Kocuria rhizosphaericola TaxID=3376284 RepID=UPI00378B47EF